MRKHINDLYEDLRDGHNLISLLEVLSGVKLVSLRRGAPELLPSPAPLPPSALLLQRSRSSQQSFLLP